MNKEDIIMMILNICVNIFEKVIQMDLNKINFYYVGKIEDLPVFSGVYIAVCDVNNYVYIGKTDKSIRGRVRNEFNGLKKRDKRLFNNKKMQIDFDKYGEEHFSWYLLCKCSGDEAIYIEDYYIKEFNSIKCGYNNRHGDLKRIKNYYKTEKIALNIINNVDEIKNILDTLTIDIFDKRSFYMASYIKFKETFKYLIYEDVTDEFIFKLIEREEFRIFIKDDYDIYYEMTVLSCKMLLNDGKNYNVLLKDIENITEKDIYVSAPRFKETDKVKQYVSEYKNRSFYDIEKYRKKIEQKKKQYLSMTKQCYEALSIYNDKEYFNNLYEVRKKIEDDIKDVKKKLSYSYIDGILIGRHIGNSIEMYENRIIKLNGLFRE